MDADGRIATYFEQLIQHDYKTSPSDYLIFLIVSVRCQMDMGGINSAFDQLLRDESTLIFFLDGLRLLDEPSLVVAFSHAHARLKAAGYFANPDLEVFDLEDEDNEDMFLQDIAEEIRAGNRLWQLDEKLCGLLPE